MSLALRSLWPWSAAVLLMAEGVAHAQQAQTPQPRPEFGKGERLELALTAGLSSSDNISRAMTDEESGTIASAGVEFDYQHQSRRLLADVNVDAAYEDYSSDSFEDGVVGGASAVAEFGIVPERFTWSVQESFGQITSDPFAANTPENRENVNYFTTGPDLTVRLGGAFSLQAGARYSDAQYEISDADGKQYAGSLALVRQVSNASQLSMHVQSDSYEFDDQVVNADYDRRQAFLRYDLTGSRTDLTVDLGYSTVDSGEDTSNGLLARVSLQRRLSRSQSLTLSLASQFSDAGDLFRDGQAAFGVGSQAGRIVGTSDPFKSRQVSINWNFQRNRTSIELGAQRGSERYENLTLFDRTLTTWRGDLRRQLSGVVELSVFGYLENQDFDAVDFDSDEMRAGAYLKWTVGRRLSLLFQYDRFDRDSSDAIGDYTENRGSIFLTWAPPLR